MSFSLFSFRLNFKKPFHIAHGVRYYTETVFIKFEHNNITGWGEAALPPYLIETVESVKQFVNNFNCPTIKNKKDLFNAISFLHELPNNYAAKAAIETALLDWYGKRFNQSIFDLLQIPKKNTIISAYTIAISNAETFIKNIEEAEPYSFLKIKMGSSFDNEIIDAIAKVVKKPFAVDANQGWKTKEEAIYKITKLQKAGALFVEQPLPIKNIEDQKWLKENCELPIFADESFQTINDLESISTLFHGINIKLIKCGGLVSALKIIEKAKELNLKILVGCMSESSCAIKAAAHLAPFANYMDLDGPLLISNDPFSAFSFNNNIFSFSEKAGLGIEKISEAF